MRADSEFGSDSLPVYESFNALAENLEDEIARCHESRRAKMAAKAGEGRDVSGGGDEGGPQVAGSAPEAVAGSAGGGAIAEPEVSSLDRMEGLFAQPRSGPPLAPPLRLAGGDLSRAGLRCATPRHPSPAPATRRHPSPPLTMPPPLARP